MPQQCLQLSPTQASDFIVEGPRVVVAKKRKLYDAEFAPELRAALRKRDVLGGANPARFVPLIYNLTTIAETMEQEFQVERKSNALNETTPPEAWIAAKIVPLIQEARPNADVDEALLIEKVKEKMGSHDSPRSRAVKSRSRAVKSRSRAVKSRSRAVKSRSTAVKSTEQQLYTTIEPYLPKIKQLLRDVFDRQKSLRGILRLPRDVYSVRDATTRCHTQREEILREGIQQKMKNHQIAKRLDDQGLKPRNKIYKSFSQMLRINPDNFSQLKHLVKKKFGDQIAPPTPNLN